MDIQILKESINTPHPQYAATPTLLPFSNSYLRWMKTSYFCSRRNALMSTPLLLGTTEVFGPWTVWWFVDNVIVLGILHALAQQTYCLQEHPRVVSITNTTIYHLPPHNIHGHCTTPIRIFNVLRLDQTPIDTTLWNIFTHQMPSIPNPHGDHHFHPPIESTTSTKRVGQTSQVNKKIK